MKTKILNGLLVLAALAVLITPLVVAAPDSISTSNILYSPMTADGYQIGDETSDKVGFHDKAPTIQRTDASQAAITNNTTGTVSDTFAATLGSTTITIPVSLPSVANGDIFTNYVPGYKFKILRVDAIVTDRVMTAAKLSTLNLEIGSTNLTGGAVALTSANCNTLGAQVTGTAVTAANTGSATDTISVEAASTTAFLEGRVVLLIKIQNMDTVDAFGSIADKLNEWRTVLVNKGLATGS